MRYFYFIFSKKIIFASSRWQQTVHIQAKFFMAKRISIQDIAREMKVSISTVSAVLNGKTVERRISEEQADKIRQYTQSIGYQPNMVARSLRTGKTNIIGMMVEDISDPFFATIARKLEQKAALINYKILFSSTENKLSVTQSLLRTYKDRQVDAYIIAPPPGMEKEIQDLQEEGYPTILFDRYFPLLKTFNVLVDNYAGSYDAVNHLIQKGRANIALVTINSSQTQMEDRLSGYLHAIKNTLQKPYVLKMEYYLDSDAAIYQIEKFIRENKSIDAILFTTNYLTASGLKALNNLSIPIPEQIAIIGYDDNINFSLYSPTISAVAQPVTAIADGIIEQLQKLLAAKNKNVQPNTILLNTNLILRESV